MCGRTRTGSSIRSHTANILFFNSDLFFHPDVQFNGENVQRSRNYLYSFTEYSSNLCFILPFSSHSRNPRIRDEEVNENLRKCINKTFRKQRKEKTLPCLEFLVVFITFSSSSLLSAYLLRFLRHALEQIQFPNTLNFSH